MRIKKVSIENFRAYEKLSVSFDRNMAVGDLFVIYGITGKGKTSFLNAIHWGLYGIERDTRSADETDILNKEVLALVSDGEKIAVKVVVVFEDKIGKEYIVKRIKEFRKEGDTVVPLSTEVLFQESDMAPYIGDDAENKINKLLIPRRVRQFFFVDGENITARFLKDTSGIIDEILDMAQISLLRDSSKVLKQVRKELLNEFSKGNETLENVSEELASKESQLDEKLKQLEDRRTEKKLIEEEIEELNSFLIGVPDIGNIKNKLSSLEKEIRELKEMYTAKMIEKRKKLIEMGMYVLLKPHSDEIRQIVSKLGEDDELPLIADISYLKKTLEDGKCVICGREIDQKIQKKLESDINKLQNQQDFNAHFNELRRNQEAVFTLGDQFAETIEMLNEHISMLHKQIVEKQTIKRELEEEIKAYDENLYNEKYLRKLEAESKLDTVSREIYHLERDVEQLKEEIAKLKEKLDRLSDIHADRKRKKQLADFAYKLIEALHNIDQEIQEEIREEIQQQTKKMFFDVVWNADFFGDIVIDPDTFSVHIYHGKTGMEITHSLSGGQAKILAMAFTIALHKVINYNSPLIVDRPIVNISGEDLLDSMVDMFIGISNQKQVILLLTPDEIPESLAKRLNANASSVWEIENTTGANAIFIRRED